MLVHADFAITSTVFLVGNYVRKPHNRECYAHNTDKQLTYLLMLHRLYSQLIYKLNSLYYLASLSTYYVILQSHISFAMREGKGQV
jgi:hypothetical protein